MNMENMISNLNKSLKTGKLKEELAKEELKTGKQWTQSELKRAMKETDTNIITRDDINMEKELLTNVEYLRLQEKISTMCDLISYISEDKQTDFKEKMLNAVNERDLIYNSIKSKYNVSF